MSEILYGVLVSWFKHRNYGFIRLASSDEEFFVHSTDILNNKSLEKGTRVQFELGTFGGKTKAIRVEAVSR